MLDRNWRGGRGELDLVVCRDAVVRFVEVKARAADDPLTPDAVTPTKQSRLRSAAKAWLLQYHDLIDEMACLVAFVRMDGESWSVEWIDNAFDGG